MIENAPQGVFLLSVLLLVIAAMAWLSRSIVRGVQGKAIVTHFGVRAGPLARVYALIYLLLMIALVGPSLGIWSALRAIPPEEIVRSFGFPLKSLPMAVVLTGMGLVALPFTIWVVRRREAKDPALRANPRRRNLFRAYVYSHSLLLIVCGGTFFFPTPAAIVFGIILFWTYVSVMIEPFGLLQDALSTPA